MTWKCDDYRCSGTAATCAAPAVPHVNIRTAPADRVHFQYPYVSPTHNITIPLNPAHSLPGSGAFVVYGGLRTTMGMHVIGDLYNCRCGGQGRKNMKGIKSF